MIRQKILIADDEPRMRRLVRDFMTAADYDVVEAADGIEALDIIKNETVDLVILDVMMPRMDGYTACAKIRQDFSVPIIMLTACGEEEDHVRGLGIGADEYVTKPISPKVLVARVDALLRRVNGAFDEKKIVGGIIFNPSAHEVYVNGEEALLTHKEFELLGYFIENRGLALSRDKILNSVWSYDFYGDARTIDSHVTKLRTKLGDCGNYIQTVRGIGYKFEVIN